MENIKVQPGSIKVQSGSLNQPSGTQPNQPSQLPSATNPWVGNLPNIAGTVGSVGGRILGGLAGGAAGTIAEPGGGTIVGAFGGEEAGGAIGGGIGQAIGEYFKELIDKKPPSAGEITKQGVIGTLYGGIPGGEASSFFTRIGARSAIGAITSGGARAIEDIGKKGKDIGTEAKDIAGSTITGAITFPLLGFGSDLGSSAIKFLGEKIPTSLIESATNAPAQKLKSIFTSIQQTLVGHDNVDYALGKGIIPETPTLTTEVINDSLQKAKDISVQVEKKLQGVLSKAEGEVKLTEKSFNGQSLYDIINSAGNQIQSTARGFQVIRSLFATIPSAESDSQMISVPTINEMKRVIGDIYSLPGMPELYNKLQTIVEKMAPESHDLNQEALKLVKIKGFLKDWKEAGKLPEGFSEQGIKDAVSQAAKGFPKSFEAFATGVALALYMTYSGLLKSTGATAAGVGVAFGIRSLIKQGLESAYESPAAKENLAKALQSTFDSASPEVKAMILDALKQLGVRVPQFLGSLGNMSPKSNPPKIISTPSAAQPSVATPRLSAPPQSQIPQL